MGEATTVRSERPAAEVLAAVSDPGRRQDAEAAVALMAKLTGDAPTVWGDSIIGFGRYPYARSDGSKHEWFAVGLAARKAALTFYGLIYDASTAELLERLGPHTTGKGCLYVKHLDKVDTDVLAELITRAWKSNHEPAT